MLPKGYVIRRTSDGLYSNGSSYRPVFVTAENACVWGTKRSVSCHASRIRGIANRSGKNGYGNYGPNPYIGCEIVECELTPKKGEAIKP